MACFWHTLWPSFRMKCQFFQRCLACLLFTVSHCAVAVTHFPANAPALRDGRGFTVMRPARLDTMEKDACCRAAAPMELTVIHSQVPVHVPLGLWWVCHLVVKIIYILLLGIFVCSALPVMSQSSLTGEDLKSLNDLILCLKSLKIYVYMLNVIVTFFHIICDTCDIK